MCAEQTDTKTEAPQAPDTLEAVRHDLARLAAVVVNVIKHVRHLEENERLAAASASDLLDQLAPLLAPEPGADGATDSPTPSVSS